MKGTGFECDMCGTKHVLPGDPFVRPDGMLPKNWIALRVNDAPPSAQGRFAELCSWACVVDYATYKRKPA